MGIAVSSSHIVSAAPSSSGGRLLTLFPCSSVGSLPQETVLHEFLPHESCPQHAALHKLLQRGSFPQGAIFQEQAAPVWVPHEVTGPASKSAPAWAPLSMGLQVLPAACSIATSHSPIWASTCSGVGSSMGCRWISAPPWISMGHRGTACLPMVFTTSCRGISSPAPGAPPPPPSLLILESAEFSLLSLAAKIPLTSFFFFL